ncbi:SDR family NAD(P)-dependent oxidoreductase [Embleya sp. AB8]|uniref:SDR family NAD(P)-dependent oxidoreductase n=1 Tax=Embleya sp. AB8 TaxID=3156304 RepID=UPI003C730591
MSVVEPIAVIGLAARLPEAGDIEQYWTNLLAGRDCIAELTDEQLSAAGEDPQAAADPAYVRACPLLPDVDRFDARFFGMTPREAELRDPQHRLFLELCHTVLGHAGYDAPRYPGAIGVFAGATTNRYAEQNLRSHPDTLRRFGELAVDIGNNSDYLATFVSYKLGLRGPSLSVATACSTSLVGVHLACQALRAGECDMAITGGVEVEMPYGRGYRHAEGGIYSPDGRCRPFDAQAGGTVFGNGGGAVLLKRLSDAQADHDRILAVIRGSAINNDGAEKVGFSAPSVNGQARCVAEAYAVADVDPATVGYVEAHGTATALGDPVEVAALTQAFELVSEAGPTPGRCGLGSVKSNIGHLGPAAGVAGLIKTVLALHREQIPPSINFTTPNPHLRLAETPFHIVTEVTPWPRAAAPRRAGVSSFGIGGTNAHVVVEEAPVADAPRPDDRAQLLVWSARDEEDERALRVRLAERFSTDPELRAADVAFTLQAGRTGHRAARAALVGADLADAGRRLARDAPAGLRRSDGILRTPVFAFPGQGAQRPAMGMALRETDPVFRAHLDPLLAAFSDELGEDLAEAARSGDAARIARTELAQPLLCATELALARTLRAYGAVPELVIGHSLGELVAAAAAGVVAEEDVVRVVAARALAVRDAPAGAMLAVQAGPAELAGQLLDGVSVTAVNAARQTVLGGAPERIAEQARQLADAGLRVRILATSHAFHTPMMAEAAERFAEVLRGCRLKSPQIPVVSAATGAVLTDSQACDPEFWAGQLTSPVRFADAAAVALARPATVVEVGPGTTMTTLLRGVGGDHVFAAALSDRAESEREGLLDAVGALWVAGGDIDWAALHEGDARRVDLPAYPYRRKRFWIDPPARRADAPAGQVSDAARPEPAAVVPAPAVPAEPATPPAATAATGVGLWTPHWTHDAVVHPVDYREPGERGSALLLHTADAAEAAGAAGARLAADALRAAGYRPIGVVLGDRLRIDGRDRSVRPGNSADLGQLLAALEDIPARVVQLVPAGTDVAHGFGTTMALCRALASAATELTVLTTSAVNVTGGEPVDAAAAMLTGLVRTIGDEMPRLTPRLIDLGGTVATRVLAAELLGAAHPVAALRGQHRWLPGWTTADLTGARPELLRSGGVYVITGGLGGIGLQSALALAETGSRPRLVLMGRRGVPEGPAGDAAREALSELAELGATALPLIADVTDAASLGAALDEVRRRFGPINGVLHAAGIAGGGLLARRDAERAEAVLAPKVTGTENLARLLAGEPELDFVLLCSSRAAVTGLIGSGDYAAANAYLDAWAGRTIAGAPVIPVNWPAWSGVGMAAASTGLAEVRAAGGHGAETGAETGAGTGTGTGRSGLPEAPAAEPSAAADAEWSRVLDPAVDWLAAEHRVAGRPVVPGTGQIDLIVRAARESGQADPGSPLELSDLVFTAPLAAEQPVEIRVEFTAGTVRLLARAVGRETGWAEYSRCRIRATTAEPAPDLAPELLDDLDPVGVDAPSRGAASLVDMGPRWGDAVDVVGSHRGDRLARFALGTRYAGDLAEHPVHPALLDRATGLVQGSDGVGHLPFHYERVVVLSDLPGEILVRAHGLRAEPRMLVGDVDVHDTEGRAVLLVRGFRMRRAEPAVPAPRPAAAPADALTPDQGTRQLLRLLSGHLLGQVAVTPPGSSLPGAAAPAGPATPVASPVPVRPAPSPATAPSPTLATPAPIPSTPVPAPAGDDVEEALRALWAEALGIPDLGLDQDFFDLGGDSLTAVQLMTRIKDRLGVDVSIGTLFQRPTVRLMAQEVVATQEVLITREVKGA